MGRTGPPLGNRVVGEVCVEFADDFLVGAKAQKQSSKNRPHVRPGSPGLLVKLEADAVLDVARQQGLDRRKFLPGSWRQRQIGLPRSAFPPAQESDRIAVSIEERALEQRERGIVREGFGHPQNLPKLAKQVCLTREWRGLRLGVATLRRKCRSPACHRSRPNLAHVVAGQDQRLEDVQPRPRIGVIVFPGSNDDRDLARAFSRLGADVEMVWHKDETLPERLDGIGLPGGFSYGDYLRCGAMARFSPIMKSVAEHANAGRPVIGICNGFQVLCESGLLPGALVRNRDLKFRCLDVTIQPEDSGGFEVGSAPLEIPIKHGEGAYVPDPARPPRVAFRYTGENPNGTTENIAGIVNEAGNVMGLMPHPEHAVEELTGGTDGARLLDAFIEACRSHAEARA